MAILHVDVSGVDWKLLREQKQELLQVIHERGDDPDDLDGIVHLLDSLQDQAARVLGEKEVFG